MDGRTKNMAIFGGGAKVPKTPTITPDTGVAEGELKAAEERARLRRLSFGNQAVKNSRSSLSDDTKDVARAGLLGE